MVTTAPERYRFTVEEYERLGEAGILGRGVELIKGDIIRMSAGTVPPTIHKFTVEDYGRMGEIGLFDEDERVELIEGEIIQMPPIGDRHLWTVNYLTRVFAPLSIEDRAVLSVQNPVQIAGYSEPQPDFCLLEYLEDMARAAKPTPATVLLAVEVSDTTVKFDRDRKVPLYARAGVPELWLIDINHRAVEVYRKPAANGYTEIETLGPGDSVSPLAFPDIAIDVLKLAGS